MSVEPLTPQASHQLRLSSATARSWYTRKGPASGPEEILREAFESGKAAILSELTAIDSAQSVLLLQNSASCRDLQKVLEGALHTYQSRSESKARKWLQIFSKKVTYYGSVLDVFVQQHPDYVALVWGTFKVLFTAVTNHEEMTKQLSKASSIVADLLPRTELTLILYPTEPIREAVALLYSRILQFILNAVRWYRQGRLKHAWNALANPWALSFKDDMDEIGDVARTVENLSKSAAKAELRETHLELMQTRSELQNLTQYVKAEFQRMAEMTLASQSVHSQISLDVRNSRNMICNVQLGQILSLSFMERLPTSGQPLQYCRSMKDRRRNGTKSLLPNSKRLESWASQTELSFLVTENRSDVSARDFFVDLINAFQTTAKFPILWALRSGNPLETAYSNNDVIRILLYQALQINPGATSSGVNPLTIVHLREAVTDEDWFHLLRQALEGMPLVYMVLDVDLVRRATGYNRHNAMVWLERFSRILGPDKVKMFVSSLCFDRGYTQRYWNAASAIPLVAESAGEGRLGSRRARRTQARAIVDPRALRRA